MGPLIKARKEARVNTRGGLSFLVKTRGGVLSSYQVQVRLPANSHSQELTSTLECRVNQILSASCIKAAVTLNTVSYTSYTITMPLSIPAETSFQVDISTKGIDHSATLKEGLVWSLAGMHETVLSIMNGNTVVEFNSQLTTVLPVAFSKFSVWSASKLSSASSAVSDPSHDCAYDFAVEPQCGLTKMIFTLKTTADVPAFDDASQPSIVIEFSREVGAYTDGFMEDLGTGIPNNKAIPCEATGILPKPPLTSLSCRLLYGVKPFKTRVIMTSFNPVATDSEVTIHIPKIFNPPAAYQWVEAQVTVYKLVGTTNTPQMQSSYPIVNNTLSIGSLPRYPSIQKATLSTSQVSAPSFDLATVDTETNLNIDYLSPSHQLGPSDSVIFQFPVYWQIIQACSSSFVSGATSCMGSPSAFQVHLSLDSTITAGVK